MHLWPYIHSHSIHFSNIQVCLDIHSGVNTLDKYMVILAYQILYMVIKPSRSGTLQPLGISTITLIDKYYPFYHMPFSYSSCFFLLNISHYVPHYCNYYCSTCDCCVLWYIIHHFDCYSSVGLTASSQHNVVLPSPVILKDTIANVVGFTSVPK